MLFLQFQIGPDRYAVEARSVVEVIPLIGLKTVPQAPKGVAGMFNYRGEAVPAVDLSELTTSQAAAERLSTRILVIRLDPGGPGCRLVGLIAEHATSMFRKQPEEFVDTGLAAGSASYLGPVLLDEQGVIQWIQGQKLLPETVRRLLFAPPVMSANATD